jgi:hypothetical protein
MPQHAAGAAILAQAHNEEVMASAFDEETLVAIGQ